MKIDATPNLLNLSLLGDGYAILQEPQALVAAYRVRGGANPWIEETSTLLAKLSQFERTLQQLRPGEQVQVLVRRVPTDPEDYLRFLKDGLRDSAPVEFRTRYADYFQEWTKDFIRTGNLGRYESYVFFTHPTDSPNGTSFLGFGKRNGTHFQAEAVLARARSWTQNLTALGLHVEPLTGAQYAELLEEELTLESNSSRNLTRFSPTFPIGEGGFATLKEKLGSVPVFFRKDHFEAGNRYGRTIYLTDIPDNGSDPMFFASLFTQRESFKISLFYRGIDQTAARSRIERQLKGDLGTLQKGNLINVDAQAQLQARQGVLEAVARGETRLLYQSTYLTVLAESYSRLKEVSDNFAAHMGNVHRFNGYYEQKSLFQSTLPLCHNKARREFLMTTRDSANCWPFFQDDLSREAGVPLGFTTLGDVAQVEPWADDLENWNAVVIGKAGSGKSFSIEQQVIRHLPFDPYVMVIDKSQSYKFLCEAAGGEYVHIDLDGNVHLNVFDLNIGKDYQGEVPAEKVSDLLNFLNVLLSEEGEKRLPNLALSHMEEALRETYLRKFKENPKDPIPLLSDLKRTLEDMGKDKERPEEFQRLCQRYRKILEPYTGKGIYANLTDRSTTFRADNSFIVFDTSRLPGNENLLSLAVFIVSNYTIKKAYENKAKGRRSWLLLDETWFLARFPAGVDFLLNLAKRSRHMALASIFATQQISDFLKDPDVRPVVDNAATKFVFQPGSTEIAVLTEALKLTPPEVLSVEGLHQVRGAYSQCFAIFGTRARGVIHVAPDPVSYCLATTHPQEVRERELSIHRFIDKEMLAGLSDNPEALKDYRLERIWTGIFRMVSEKLSGKKG